MLPCSPCSCCSFCCCGSPCSSRCHGHLAAFAIFCLEIQSQLLAAVQLYLENNNLDDSQVDNICTVIATHPSLFKLRLGRNDLSPAAISRSAVSPPQRFLYFCGSSSLDKTCRFPCPRHGWSWASLHRDIMGIVDDTMLRSTTDHQFNRPNQPASRPAPSSTTRTSTASPSRGLPLRRPAMGQCYTQWQCRHCSLRHW